MCWLLPLVTTAFLFSAALEPRGVVAASDAGNWRVAVCVVGQVGRTEIRSKVENLIKPNLGVVHMDFFLILQTGQPRYSTTQASQCKAAPSSVDEARAAFSSFTRTFAFESAFVEWSVQPERWNGFPIPEPELRMNIVTNSLNRYLSWKRCATLVAQREVEDGSGSLYDAVLKIRDNSLVLRPFALKERLTSLVRSKFSEVGLNPPDPITNAHVRDLPVVLKGCANWEGYADKTLLVPRIHLLSALSGPADEFHLIPRNENLTWINGEIVNSETYIKFVFDKLHVPVLEEPDPALFPITDGRCEDGDNFCVVKMVKDCRPSGPTAQKECSRDYTLYESMLARGMP